MKAGMFHAIRGLLVACVCGSAAATPGDDFADDAVGPQWTLLQDAPAELFLAEQNGRLEVFANAPTSGATDALYLSNGPGGFRLSTASDFLITLDYALTGWDSADAAVGDAMGLALGVGRDLDGTDAAAISFALSKQLVLGFPVVGTAVVEGHRTDDVQDQNILAFGGNESGTLAISYDAAGDDLTLGIGSDTFTLEDTVRAVWQAEALFVSFGARGNGFRLGAGDAWLDDFTVVTGDVIAFAAIPGDYNASGLVEQGDLDLVLQNWGDATPPVPAGWVGDPPTGLVDQAELDRVLQTWGSAASPVTPGGGRRGVAIPEPAGLAGAFLAVGAVRRRRSG